MKIPMILESNINFFCEKLIEGLRNENYQLFAVELIQSKIEEFDTLVQQLESSCTDEDVRNNSQEEIKMIQYILTLLKKNFETGTGEEKRLNLNICIDSFKIRFKILKDILSKQSN
jgi:hypothetical protein